MENCKDFEPGFSRMKNNSLNDNQKKGKPFFYLMTTTVFFSILNIYTRIVYKKYFSFLLYPFLLLLSISVLYIISDPMIVVRAGDYFVALNVETDHILDKEKYFPAYKEFEDKHKIIQEELTHLLQDTNCGKDIGFTRDTYGNGGIGRDVDEEKNRGWRVYHIKLGNDIIKGTEKYFPNLIETINKYPEIKNVTISILDEKTTIPIHVGYYKGIMRFMLALKVPKQKEECYLCINGDKYVWEEGKTILWDDNFPHKVFNKTEEQRVVVYMDIVRPDLSWGRKKFNSVFESIIYNSPIIKEEVKRTEKRQNL